MSGKTSTTKVHCTYPDCPRFFKSVQDMKFHKTKDVEHDYCSLCDEDFEDEERLLIHKIKNKNHIVCGVCGIDFKSEGGRDMHIRQNHPTEQHLVCYGCKATFKRASALMHHIEADECPKINRTRLIQEQSKKLLIKEALKAQERQPMLMGPEDTEEVDGVDGGVKIESLMLENHDAVSNYSKTHEDATNSNSTASGENAFRVDASSDLMSFSQLSVEDKPNTWKAKQQRAPTKASVSGQSTVSWGARSSEAESSLGKDKGPFGLEGLLSPGRTLRTLNEDWDPTRFFNSFTGAYSCPCGDSFETMKEFQEHILKKTNARKSVQCPGCFKTFKSTTALIAHCESPSIRCSINDASMYGQIIDEITGGLVQTSYNNDGTIRYEAGKLDLSPEANNIGVDLDSIHW